MPPISAGAIFSSIPQTGKLKALMWIATPRSGVRTCCAAKLPSLDSGSTGPSVSKRAFGSSRRARLAKVRSVPIPPSMSGQASLGVAPVARLSAWKSSFISISAVPTALSISARSWIVKRRSAVPPTSRPQSSAPAKSSPSEVMVACVSPVAAFSSGLPSPAPRRQPPST